MTGNSVEAVRPDNSRQASSGNGLRLPIEILRNLSGMSCRYKALAPASSRIALKYPTNVQKGSLRGFARCCQQVFKSLAHRRIAGVSGPKARHSKNRVVNRPPIPLTGLSPASRDRWPTTNKQSASLLRRRAERPRASSHHKNSSRPSRPGRFVPLVLLAI